MTDTRFNFIHFGTSEKISVKQVYFQRTEDIQINQNIDKIRTKMDTNSRRWKQEYFLGNYSFLPNGNIGINTGPFKQIKWSYQ